jgi:septum formation protein
MEQLVLASTSPRRRDILNFFSLPFIQVSPDFDETLVPFHGDPAAFSMETARRKALCLRERYPNHPILAADTVVYREGRLFLKPENLEEAFCMLSELSGKEHSVFTGVSLLEGPHQFNAVEETKVLFHELSAKQIRSYHLQFNPLDKAGAYAIQQGGSVIVKRIQGCYYNIMGLPLTTTRLLLSKVGIDLWDYLISV